MLCIHCCLGHVKIPDMWFPELMVMPTMLTFAMCSHVAMSAMQNMKYNCKPGSSNRHGPH